MASEKIFEEERGTKFELHYLENPLPFVSETYVNFTDYFTTYNKITYLWKVKL